MAVVPPTKPPMTGTVELVGALSLPLGGVNGCRHVRGKQGRSRDLFQGTTPRKSRTRVFCSGRTQHHAISAAAAKSRVCNANCGTGRRRSHAPTADGSTADGTRRSTGDTQNMTQKMGESAGTGEALA